MPLAARRLFCSDEQGELVRRDKLALVKNPLNVLQEIELAPIIGRSGRTILDYDSAARRIDWIAAAAFARGLTGVGLKDDSAPLVGSTPVVPG